MPQDRGQRSAITDNVLNRQFQADAPNQKWVADFTYIWAAEGWLYAAAVLDLYSRRIAIRQAARPPDSTQRSSIRSKQQPK